VDVVTILALIGAVLLGPGPMAFVLALLLVVVGRTVS
jgi:hypothetical protein